MLRALRSTRLVFSLSVLSRFPFSHALFILPSPCYFSFPPLPRASCCFFSRGLLISPSSSGFLFPLFLTLVVSPFSLDFLFPPLPWVFRVFLSLRLLVSLAPSILNARHAARLVKARCQRKVLKIKLVLTVLVLDLTVTGHLVSLHNQEFSSPLE